MGVEMRVSDCAGAAVGGKRYPVLYPSRILVSLVGLGVSGVLWKIGMGMPAAWMPKFMTGRVAITPIFPLVAMVIVGLALPAKLMGLKDTTPLGVNALCFYFDMALLVSWWVIFFRPGRKWRWFSRLLSLGLLLAWIPASAAMSTDAPGDGFIYLANGCTVLCAAVWLVPGRVEGEPWLVTTVLWRLVRGRAVLRREARGFSVVEGYQVAAEGGVASGGESGRGGALRE